MRPQIPGYETLTVHIPVPKSLLYDESVPLEDLYDEFGPLAADGLKTALSVKRCEKKGHIHPAVEELRQGRTTSNVQTQHLHPS